MALSKQCTRKIKNDFEAALENLALSISAYEQGRRSAYRIAAVQLRTLLCDGKNTLLPRVFENVHLHPFSWYISKDQDKEWQQKFGYSLKDAIVFQQPFSVYVGEDGVRIARLFAENKEPIHLEEWLNQPLFNRQLPLRELIRSIADKEGAHSDASYNATLEFTRASTFGNESVDVAIIIALGKYVLRIISQM